MGRPMGWTSAPVDGVGQALHCIPHLHFPPKNPPLQKSSAFEFLNLIAKQKSPRNRLSTLGGASRRPRQFSGFRREFYSGYIIRPSSNLFRAAELMSRAPRMWWLCTASYAPMRCFLSRARVRALDPAPPLTPSCSFFRGGNAKLNGGGAGFLGYT